MLYKSLLMPPHVPPSRIEWFVNLQSSQSRRIDQSRARGIRLFLDERMSSSVLPTFARSRLARMPSAGGAVTHSMKDWIYRESCMNHTFSFSFLLVTGTGRCQGWRLPKPFLRADKSTELHFGQYIVSSFRVPGTALPRVNTHRVRS